MSFAAGTHIATIDGNRPIEKLPKTGMVQTYDGSYVPFTFSGPCGTEYTIILTMSNGGEIICTPDQMFLTNEDWTEAKDSKDTYLYDEYMEDIVYVKSIRSGGTRRVYKLGVVSGDCALGNGMIIAT